MRLLRGMEHLDLLRRSNWLCGALGQAEGGTGVARVAIVLQGLGSLASTVSMRRACRVFALLLLLR